MIRHALAGAWLTALTLALPLAAQDGPAPGTRIRITEATSPPVTHVGRLAALSDGYVTLEAGAREGRLPLARIARMEVSEGRPFSVTWGIVGGVLGAAAGGFALGCLANRDSYGVLCAGQNDTKLAIGAVTGGLAGAALGALLGRRERWRPAALPAR